MDLILDKLAINAPTAVALIIVVRMFLNDRREDRKIWENHLSQMVLVLQKLLDGQDEHRKRTEKE